VKSKNAKHYLILLTSGVITSRQNAQEEQKTFSLKGKSMFAVAAFSVFCLVGLGDIA
jgi:hypothetical protein